jgi:hypothetical protein
MRLNTAAYNLNVTFEGGPAVPRIKPIDQLRRSVLSCLLWENEFYEDGKNIADRIIETAHLGEAGRARRARNRGARILQPAPRPAAVA